MRLPLVLLAAFLLSACAAQNTTPDPQDNVYDSETVLFVRPDSAALDSLREAMGEDAFYTVADDVNYYRAQAYPLLDSLNIPYEFVDRQPLRFEVQDSVATYRWRDVEAPWFTVVYDGHREPRVTSAVDLGSELEDSLR